MKKVKVAIIVICLLSFIGVIPILVQEILSVRWTAKLFYYTITTEDNYGATYPFLMGIFAILFCLLMICLSVLVLVYMFKGDKEVQYTYQEHKERIAKNIADRRLARQEKKLAALEEKQKSIQDELDRMK